MDAYELLLGIAADQAEMKDTALELRRKCLAKCQGDEDVDGEPMDWDDGAVGVHDVHSLATLSRALLEQSEERKRVNEIQMRTSLLHSTVHLDKYREDEGESMSSAAVSRGLPLASHQLAASLFGGRQELAQRRIADGGGIGTGSSFRHDSLRHGAEDLVEQFDLDKLGQDLENDEDLKAFKAPPRPETGEVRRRGEIDGLKARQDLEHDQEAQRKTREAGKREREALLLERASLCTALDDLNTQVTEIPHKAGKQGSTVHSKGGKEESSQRGDASRVANHAKTAAPLVFTDLKSEREQEQLAMAKAGTTKATKDRQAWTALAQKSSDYKEKAEEVAGSSAAGGSSEQQPTVGDATGEAPGDKAKKKAKRRKKKKKTQEEPAQDATTGAEGGQTQAGNASEKPSQQHSAGDKWQHELDAALRK